MTVKELAAEAGVTEEIMLRRIATVIQNRSWPRRVMFNYSASRALGFSVASAFIDALLHA